MSNPKKDLFTTRLRDEILATAPEAQETDRADAMIITLSFRSKTLPQRHVWIDTYTDDQGSTVSVDLEDWDQAETFDNSVGTVTLTDLVLISELVAAWLSGETLDHCLALIAEDTVHKK